MSAEIAHLKRVNAELLAALQSVVDWDDDPMSRRIGGSWHDVIGRARAAIKKATQS